MATNAKYQQFMGAVEETLERVIKKENHPTLAKAAQHLCIGTSGKRVRPSLVWAFAHCLESPPVYANLIDVAVAAELIHTASLLHDDVIDHGTIRRGLPTVNAKWSNTVAVLAGDLILTLAFEQILKHQRSLLNEAMNTIANMTRAAITEVESRGNLDIPPEHWRSIVKGKTGELFAWCGKAVAHLAQDKAAVNCFAQCGIRLGIAFQMADDLLDLVGTQTGKNKYSDLENKEINFIVLSAARLSPSIKDKIQKLWESDRTISQIENLGNQIIESPAILESIDLLNREITAAHTDLAEYSNTPGAIMIIDWANQLHKRLDPSLSSHLCAVAAK